MNTEIMQLIVISIATVGITYIVLSIADEVIVWNKVTAVVGVNNTVHIKPRKKVGRCICYTKMEIIKDYVESNNLVIGDSFKLEAKNYYGKIKVRNLNSITKNNT